MEINKDTSYLIGLFQTDGSMSEESRNRGKFRLELSSKDEDIIFKVKDLIPFNYNIRKRTKESILKGKTYNNETIQYTVYNLNFRNFLLESGVPYGKKSKIIKPPLHLDNLSEIDYVRGLYDGDGSLGMTKKDIPYVSFTTDSDDIVEYLVNFISIVTNKPLKSLNRNKRDNIYNIVITKEDAIVFCETVYYNNCLSIERKYKKANIIKEWKRPLGMKHNDNRKKWTKDQDEFILNHDIDESVDYLDRTEESIKMRLWRLKKEVNN